MAAWQKKKKAKRCFFERAIASVAAPLIIDTIGKILGKYLKKEKEKEEKGENEEKKYEKKRNLEKTETRLEQKN